VPDFLTKDEIKKLFGELAKLSPYHVREFYRQAWDRCRPDKGVPRAEADTGACDGVEGAEEVEVISQLLALESERIVRKQQNAIAAHTL
jgi:hypothetical protein